MFGGVPEAAGLKVSMILPKGDPLRRWLEQATPEERHLFVSGWESDAAAAVLDWVIRRPDCEKATALMAYWLNSPVYFAEYGPTDDDDVDLQTSFRLLREIEDRYLTGFYQRQSIAFDPSKAFVSKMDLAERYRQITPVEPIPAEMLVPVEGREAVTPEGWENGMPADVAKAWDDYIEGEGWKRLPG